MKRIEEIIELIEITGDKCIILHQERSSAYVVMKFEDYKGFYKNHLYPPENQASQRGQAESVVQSVNQPEPKKIESKIRPIPQRPVDVQQFEIKRPVLQNFDDEDVYYPEPLIE